MPSRKPVIGCVVPSLSHKPLFLAWNRGKMFLKIVDIWYYTWYYINKKGSEKVANVDKIIEKMKRQPNGIRPEEVEKGIHRGCVKSNRGVNPLFWL